MKSLPYRKLFQKGQHRVRQTRGKKTQKLTRKDPRKTVSLESTRHTSVKTNDLRGKKKRRREKVQDNDWSTEGLRSVYF